MKVYSSEAVFGAILELAFEAVPVALVEVNALEVDHAWAEVEVREGSISVKLALTKGSTVLVSVLDAFEDAVPVGLAICREISLIEIATWQLDLVIS